MLQMSLTLKPVENTGFFALYFSIKKRSEMLQQIQHPALISVLSFVQWPIVGHISQIRLYITIENRVGVAHRVMDEQVVQL